MPSAKIIVGDCLSVMADMEPCSVDAIVTDPPYGLSFMNSGWDAQVPGVDYWKEMLRVAKPGAHLLAFGGTRTFHRMMVAIEDAGWEIRDTIMWTYGSGFPKSHNVAAAIDKSMGHPNRGRAIPTASTYQASDVDRENKLTSNPVPPYEPQTPEAAQWEGWGTALKPAWEPIIMARKPLEGTVAANVLKYGTGGLNIDGCRIPTNDDLARLNHQSASWAYGNGPNRAYLEGTTGRWPANLIHDGSEEVLALFPETTSGSMKPGQVQKSRTYNVAKGVEAERVREGYKGSTGSAARFFYCAKASRKDRDEGLEGFREVTPGEITGGRKEGSAGLDNPRAGAGRTSGGKNIHPTVKPTDLMRYLVRMVTPLGGLVLDPFAGSGSTGKAAALEMMDFVGIELSEEYARIAHARLPNLLGHSQS